MNLFLFAFITGASFLLSFLLFFHPLQQNVIANKWLSFFVFIIGSAFLANFFLETELSFSNGSLFKCLNSLQFLLAPTFYICILYFVKPAKTFEKIDWLHFAPFVVYVVAEHIWNYGKATISTFPLFNLYQNKPFLVLNILPIITLFYLIQSFRFLIQHKTKLKLIASNIEHIDLDWLIQLLYILSLSVIFWMNDALFGFPFMTEATNFVHAGAIFFVAYFSIKQKTIFSFKEKDIKEISEVLEYKEYKAGIKSISEAVETNNIYETTTDFTEVAIEKQKTKRLSEVQIKSLSEKLSFLMEKDKLFLDNDLNLPTVAEKLGISIHEASFLINETAKDNFYNYVNKFRIDEAKKLLKTSKIEELNMLGIAFASGFNSKTAFYTTFKKLESISPSQFSKKNR